MSSEKISGQEKIEHGLKLLVKSSFIVFIGLFFSKLFYYFYRVIIARHFGPEIYGTFSLAIIILTIFMTFFSLGIPEGVLRFVSLYRGKNEFKKIKYIFRVSIKYLLILSIIASIILFFSSDFFSIQVFDDLALSSLLKIFAFIIPFLTFSYLFLYFLRAFEKIFWYSFIFNILQNFTKVIFLILLIFLGAGVNSLAFSYSAGIIFMFLFSFFVCAYYFSFIFKSGQPNMRIKHSIKKDFFAYSWPIMFFGIISSFLYWIDSISLAYFRTSFEVGVYNAAFPLAALIGFIPEIFLQLFLPLITKEFSRKNLNYIRELSKQITKWIFIFNLPPFFILFLFSQSVLTILFGSEYAVAGNALKILTFGVFFSSIFFSAPKNLLSMAGKSKTLLFSLIFSAVINFFLNILLVPAYGINGAAIATTISGILLGILFFTGSKYYLDIIPLRRKMFKILIISIIPFSIMVLLIKIPSIPLSGDVLFILFSILIYILLVLFTGCLDKNDLQIIKTIFKKSKSILFFSKNNNISRK